MKITLEYVILVIILLIITWCHVEWIYLASHSKLVILFIIISLFIFFIIFVEHVYHIETENDTYNELTMNNLAKLKNNSYVNINNKACRLVYHLLQHPILSAENMHAFSHVSI